MVILGQRCHSYSLVDMRLHDVSVVADVNRHDPNAPNPTDSAQQDGTLAGRIDPGAVEDTDPWQYAVTVDSWWTGWWPLLHLRFSRASPGGASLTVQVRVGLLPTDFALEEVSFSSGQPQDPLVDSAVQDSIVDSVVSSFQILPAETVALYLIGLAAASACQVVQAGCQPWLVTIASALVTSYVLLFTTLLLLFATIVTSVTSNPWVVLVSIAIMGLSNLLGLMFSTIVFPSIGNRLLSKVPLIGRFFSPLRGLAEWWDERTDASLLFIFVKVFLIGFTFAVALLAAGMTAFGLN
ncbi:MAG: hypothetical protein HXY34_04025 [Candidatus Thorarchaeota archaeon]|nr:hypothetical protein [Candidatus Thorarchaeota archaeon]